MKKRRRDRLGAEGGAPNVEQKKRTPNTEHRTPNAESKRRKNAERRTPNVKGSGVAGVVNEATGKAYGGRKYDLEERLLGFATTAVKLADSLPSTKAGNH